MIYPASYFDNRWGFTISLGWGKLYVHFPIYSKYDECDPPRYGFYYFENAFWLCLGSKIKSFHMPWHLEWVRTSCLLADEKTWEHEVKGDRGKNFWDNEKWGNKLFSQTWPYKYVLKSGAIQNVNATIRVEEREWRRNWLMWTKAFRLVRRSINIDFDGEVGERAGSWKGGTTGCGYDLKPYETPSECLFRMERERKVD